MPDAPDPRRCPLCGAPNDCALANRPADGSQVAPACWCAEIAIAPEVLKRVPERLQGRACICRRCTASAKRAQRATSERSHDH